MVTCQLGGAARERARGAARSSCTGSEDDPFTRGVVTSYLRDLRGTLETDPDEARRLLSVLVGRIPIRREGKHLVAEVRGNLPALLGEDICAIKLVPGDRL